MRLYAAEKKDKNRMTVNLRFLILANPIINKISPSRLKVKGPPKLLIIKINQSSEKKGAIFSNPELK